MLGFLLLAITETSYQTPFHNLALAIIYGVVPLAMAVMATLFIVAGFIALSRESRSIRHALAILFGFGVIGGMIGIVALLSFEYKLPTWILMTAILMVIALLYVLFTFYALMIYSFLYQILPRKKDYKFIIVHGSGLINGKEVPPLLASRLNKAIYVYEKLNKIPKIIVSGGQGSDESTSEAAAMKKYLQSQGISGNDILLEDKSTTTFENLTFSKKLIDKLDPNAPVLFVTNNYHVFRTSIYAREAGLSGDGVGSSTALYYWPNGFIREYVAIIIRYRLVPVLLLIFWAVVTLISLL